MTVSLEELLLPNGFHFDEFWDAQNIKGTNWPGKPGGHALTLTGGAYKALSTNGLIMRGAERVTITYNVALNIVDNLTLVFPEFELNTLFSSASTADMGVMNFNNGMVIARLESDTGAMVILLKDADGGVDYIISSTKVSWAAGIRWQVSITFTDTGVGGVEIFVNGASDSTHDDADTVLTNPAGNTVYGYDLTTYLTGKFTRGPRIFSTVLLTAAELLDLYHGLEEATNLVLQHNLDEGRGLAIDDKATGAVLDGVISGTITASIWDFDERAACMGLDGRTGYAVSGVVVDLSGDLTILCVTKWGSDFDALASTVYLYDMAIDGTNRYRLLYSADTLAASLFAGGVDNPITLTKPTINTPQIIVSTYDGANFKAYQNGVYAGLNAETTRLAATGATAYIGRNSQAALNYDIDKPICLGIIRPAMSAKQVLDMSIAVNNWKGLGITI